jgi:hypothetical protein
VAPAGPFWEAEPEHQDYLERYPNGCTCHYVRPNWVLPRRTHAATGERLVKLPPPALLSAARWRSELAGGTSFRHRSPT